MAKKKKIYTELEVCDYALNELKNKYFGGLSPSDHDSNWSWAKITDFNGNVYGITLRFGLECFAQSYSELGFYPVFDKDNCEKLLHYKRKEDLTEEELHELKASGFLHKRP